MKTVSFSPKTHPATFKKCKNFGQLLAVIEKQGEQEKLFVAKIFLNGKLMDQDEENLLENLSISEVATLEVQFSTIGELVQASLADIIKSIQVTQATAIKFAKEFREAQALDDEKLKYALIQCRTIIESLEEVFTAHANQSFTIKHPPLWQQSEKELTNILQCILQSRKMSDYEFVSDLIEYDLIHALDLWEETLEKELIDNPLFSKSFKLNLKGSSCDNGVDV